MTQYPDAEEPAPQEHGFSGTLPENIIIVSDISIIAGCIDAVVDIESGSFDPSWKKCDFIEELRSADGQMLLLLEGRLPKGYLCARKIIDETHLNKICIHPDRRGRGYGKLLLDYFVATLSGMQGKIYLEVARSNTAAIGLYKRSGFRVNRVRKKIYENGDDAFEMVLDQ